MGKLWLISGTWHSDWVKAVSRVSLHFKHLLQLLKMFSSDVERFSSKNTKGLKDAVLFKMPEVGHGLGKWGLAWGSGAWPGEVGHGLGKWGMAWLSIHSVSSFQDTARVDIKVHVQVTALVTQPCLTLSDPMDYSPPDSSCPWDSPGKSTGVWCHFLLQGIFLTQGSNRGLLRSRRILHHLSPQGSL